LGKKENDRSEVNGKMNIKGFNLFRGLTAFLLMIFSLSCSKLPEIPRSTTKPMTPVFEVFVYARCPNCPVVEDVLDSLKKVYSDSVVVLEYHLRVLGDTLSPENISERQALYNVGNQAPITVIHGEEKIIGNQGVTYDGFATYYRSVRSGREDSLGVNGVLREQSGDSLTFLFQCDTLLNLESSKAFAFLTCDSVFFKQGRNSL